MADNGVTYNSSVTYQHAVAHDPDVRTQPNQTLSRVPMHAEVSGQGLGHNLIPCTSLRG